MKIALLIIQLLVSVALIATILLQSGRSAGLSGAITGGAETLLGRKPKGLDELLRRISIILAAVFMSVTLLQAIIF